VHVVTPGPADCGAGNTETPVFSADGSHIAYLRRWSWIDYSNTIDLYVHDLGTGADVSVTRTGTDPASCGLGGASSEPVFSEDGETLVFVSTSRLVTTDLFFQPDIYAYEMDTQIPTLVSATPAGTNSMGSAAAPSISPSGTLIAFRSSGADLGPTDTNSVDDIYVRDLASGTTVLGTARTDGTAAGGAFLSRPTFDATGTRLAFSTSSSGLGPVDTAGSVDAYVRDLSSRTNHLVSVNAVGTDSARGASENPMFLADGRVVFQSSSSDLGPPDAGADQDVYVRDLAAGTTTLLSRNRDGTDGGNGETSWFMVSADRTTVGMMSMASNLGPADGNGTRDLFVARYVRSADLQLDVTGGTDPVPPGGTVSLHATLSNSGPDVAGGTAVAVLVPPEVTVESLSSSVGTCQLTPVAAGVAACEIGDLAVDARVDLDIDLTIGGAVATDTVDVDVMAVSPTPDPQPGGGAVTVTIQIAT
jgi:dipeptidyl aminopeptidase/acylaminoacyl peptidase